MTFQNQTPKELILFFDGVCGLCNKVVDFVISRDRKKVFSFAPLQGEIAAKRLTRKQVESLESLVLISDGKVMEKSDAVLEICSHLGGLWRIVTLGRVVPTPFRDRIYDWVAAHRYQWFGKMDTCRLPTPEERERFL